jgi:hypothetical protein
MYGARCFKSFVNLTSMFNSIAVKQFFPASMTSWSPRAALHISIQNMTGAPLITPRYHENSNDSILQPKHKNFKGRLENERESVAIFKYRVRYVQAKGFQLTLL